MPPEPNRPPSAPRAAATVVLLRDAPGGFEVYMVRRHGRSGFMAGAHVFPGGKLDDADMDGRVLACATGRTPEEAGRLLGEPDDPARAAGLHVAAIRETFEEAGILLGECASPARISEARDRLAQGGSFVEILTELGAQLRLDLLVPWTRWITPEIEPRRYDTRFFLARAPADQEPRHDRRETTEAVWLTPATAVARGAAGEIFLPPPTLRSLEILAQSGSIADALTRAAAQSPPLVDPVLHDLGGGSLALVIPGDPAHPRSEAVLAGPTRYLLSERRWATG